MNATKTVPEKRDSRLFGVLQRVGRSFMLPIALLPIAGLLLGVGASLTNAAMIESYGLEKILGEGTILNSVLRVLSAVGSIIFELEEIWLKVKKRPQLSRRRSRFS